MSTVMQSARLERGSLRVGGKVLVTDVVRADTLFTRMRGLLGCRSLPVGQGLWLLPCASIHMVGMRFPIDVVFLDRELRIISTKAAVRPMGCAVGGRGAYSALEVGSGWLGLELLKAGTQLSWVTG